MGKVLSAAPAPGHDRLPEAEPHLREVLESHPVPLVRLEGDGTFLAVNQQGLALFGARSLEEILGSSLIGLVKANEREGCRSLVASATKGEPGSLEVDLVGLTGPPRTFELRAVAYPPAPDGVPSALVSFRDITDAIRLSRSLVEAVEAQTELGLAYAAERSQLVADLELARQEQSRQSESGGRLTELEQRLAALNEERTALETAHDAEIARLRESQAEERRRSEADSSAAVARLDAAGQELAQLQARCEALASERGQLIEESGRLRAETEARQSSVDALTAQLAAFDVERQVALAAATDLRRTLDEHQAQAAALASRVTAVDAELATLRQAAEAEKAASDSSLRTLEARYTDDTDALRNALNDVMEEQAKLAQALARAEEDAARTAARLQEAEAVAATRLPEAEARLAQATARADDALAAIQRAETEFASQRQRLEEALNESVGAERMAQSALTAEIASRSQAERAHEDLRKAIQRLAVDTSPSGELPAAASGLVDDTELGDPLASLRAELPSQPVGRSQRTRAQS